MKVKSLADIVGKPLEPGAFPESGTANDGAMDLLQATWPRLRWALLLLVPSVLIGWLDHSTGWELSLSVLYAAPILTAAWWLGRDAGLLLALANAVIWWAANETSHPYSTPWGYHWAVASRLFFFCITALGASALHHKQVSDEARIRSLERQRQLERDILSVSEYEQQRIGQDLHDGLCQQLAAIGCAAGVLAQEMRSRGAPEVRDVEQIEEYIHRAVIEARSLARGISPVHVDQSGLSVALAELVTVTSRLTGTRIELAEGSDADVNDPDIAMHLYRIAQEAVANAVRHGNASHVTISLRDGEGSLEMRIEDDGVGFDDRRLGGDDGMGLRTMRYRAEVLGAHLEVRSRPGEGTSVICRLETTAPKQEVHP